MLPPQEDNIIKLGKKKLKHKNGNNEQDLVSPKTLENRLKGVKLMCVSGLLGISLITGGIFLHYNITQPYTIEKEAGISFEDAVKNSSLRQQYIAQKSKTLIKLLEIQHDTKLVNKIIYDPQYTQLDELCRKGIEKYGENVKKSEYFRNFLLNNTEQRKTNEELIFGQAILSTADMAQGEASDIYLSDDCFNPERIFSEDEFLSIIDHELNHALTNNKGVSITHEAGLMNRLNNNLDATDLDTNLNLPCLEVVAYHNQILLIENDTRTVRNEFRQWIINSYYKFYQEVKSVADKNDGSFDSRFCTALIESLTYYPDSKRK